MKLNRAYVSCFNVYPEFAATFFMPKSRNGGEFEIKFMHAAFNKEAGSGEFFIEFEDKVWDSNLLKAFENLGAGDVYVGTFKNNDGNDSAANALLRVWELAEKSGIEVTRGKCPDALMAKTRAKQAEAKNKKKESEFDEKTQAAIKASMESMEGKIDHVDVKIDLVGGQLTNVENGMCKTIPYYQAELEKFKAALAHKTLECDRLEKKVADTTRLKNELRDANFVIGDQQQELRGKDQELLKKDLEIEQLKRELKLHESLEVAKWVMEVQQRFKRPRTDSDAQ